MWAKLHQLSVRKQLVILFGLVIVMGSMGQLYYSFNFYKMQRNENTEISYAVISRTDTSLSQAVSDVSGAVNKIANDQNVQRLLKLQNNPSTENITERSILGDMISLYFGGIVESNTVISDVAIVNMSNQITTYNRQFDYVLFKQLEASYDGRVPNNRLVSVVVDRQANAGLKGYAYISPVYDRSSIYKSEQVLGYCIIWSNPGIFLDIVRDSAATENATVLLTDEQDMILAQKLGWSTEGFGDILAVLSQEYESAGEQGEIRKLSYAGNPYYVLIKLNELTGWKSINITPVDEIYQESRRMLLLGLALAGATIATTMLFGIYLIRSITNPLVQIVVTLRRIGRGDRNQRLPINLANHEFSVIGKRANELLDNINTASDNLLAMQAKLYEREYRKKDSELRMLQNQINPHFLYNTFECIRGISMVKGIKEISAISTGIANIFRYSTSGGAFTTLDDELKCVRDYCKVIGIRLVGRLETTVEVAPELIACSVPKMSLLPLVENAVNYGLEGTVAVLQIKIKGWIEDGVAIFSVQDNGVGIASEQLEFINKTLRENVHYDTVVQRRSIGLNNINLRLKLYYGDEFGLQVAGGKDEGISVVMRMKYVQMT